jgi:hypothetical protein
MVLLGVVIGNCEMPSTDISQENDHAILIYSQTSICDLQTQINSSGPTLPFFLNLFYRNIIGTYLSILSLLCRKIVNTLFLQMDVFGQFLQFTPLFIANLVEILPNMYGSSDLMVSSTF